MSFNSLPAELIVEILCHVPVLDYFHLKLAGCRYLTDVVRRVCASLPRGKYLAEISAEDKHRRGPDAKTRRAMEVMIARGECGLVTYYKQKYSSLTVAQDYRMAEYGTKRGAFGPLVYRRSFRMAIHWAAYHGSKEAVEILLDHIHLRAGKYGWTPLHFAALGGQLEITAFLLQNGAHVNAFDDLGRTPLNISANDEESLVAPTLLAHGAKLHIRDVLGSREEEWVKQYLDQQMNSERLFEAAHRYIPTKLVQRFSALRLYYHYRRWLIRDIRPPEQRTRLKGRVIRAALRNGFPILISSVHDGWDVNAPLPDYGLPSPALHMAITKNLHSTIIPLLNLGAHPTATSAQYPHKPESFQYETALETAIASHRYTDSHRVTALQIFLDHGLHVNSTVPDGRTAAHMAAANTYTPVLEHLLKYNVDVRATDNDGNTPLHVAAYLYRSRPAKLLVEAGADPEARNHKGRTPLAESCSPSPSESIDFIFSNDVVRLLLSVGADPHGRDKEGLTPVCHTVRCRDDKKNKAIMQALREHGVDVGGRCCCCCVI